MVYSMPSDPGAESFLTQLIALVSSSGVIPVFKPWSSSLLVVRIFFSDTHGGLLVSIASSMASLLLRFCHLFQTIFLNACFNIFILFQTYEKFENLFILSTKELKPYLFF